MKILMMGAAAALLMAGSAFAAEVSAAWDTNADGMISADEFSVAMENQAMFSAWDADADGMISADEFSAGTWRMFDADADNNWNADETSAWIDAATRSGAEVSQ